MQVAGVIPARMESTRLPGKPLLEIGGVPMIVRVLHRAKACPRLATWSSFDPSSPGSAESPPAKRLGAAPTRAVSCLTIPSPPPETYATARE